MPRLLALLALLLTAAPATAAALPDGFCAVILASRRDLAEVSGWTAANPGFEVQGLYRAANGYLAISGGVIAVTGWREEVARRKAAGRAPADAFCSGRGLVAEVWSRADGTPPPWKAVATAPEQTGDDLFSAFDARGLEASEKRVLQAALAIEGAYVGLLDGAWGSGSQSALDGWSRATFGRDATRADAALLLDAFATRVRREGWSWADPSGLGLHLLLPLGRMVRSAPEPGRMDFEDTGRGILVIVDEGAAVEVAGLHAAFLEGPLAAAPYQLRRQEVWVTAVARADGSDIYLRSDRRGTGWITTLVAAPHAERADDLVIASIAAAGPPALTLPAGGRAAGWVADLQEALAEAEEADRLAVRTDPNRRPEEQEAAGLAPAPAQRSPGTASLPPSVAEGGGGEPGSGDAAAGAAAQQPTASGTGFRVAADGTLLTNNHVVAGCARITADGMPAAVAEASESFDLAVLSVPRGAGGPWLPLATDGPRLNADVTVAGYPLHGLLGGINVTRGAISSLRGLGGDDHTMQMSAPIQPGNSGGAVVDRAGRVVGVVVAKLDEEALRRQIGVISQNVNFAIRGDIARLVLDRAGVAYETAATGEALSPEDLADRLTAATALILCY